MKMKYTRFQIALEVIGILILVGMIILIFARWNQIPQQIPLHYNLVGEIDNWGSKDAVLLLPAISILIYAILTVLSFFPKFWNVSVIITEENKETVYFNMRNLFLSIKVEIMAIFFLILYYITIAQPMPIFISPLFLLIIVCTIIFPVLRITRS